jgi:hypothetical protein
MVLSIIHVAYARDKYADPKKVDKAIIQFRNAYDRELIEGRTQLYQDVETMATLVSIGIDSLAAIELGWSSGPEVSIAPMAMVKAWWEGAGRLPLVQNTLEDWKDQQASQGQWEKYQVWRDSIETILENTTTSENPLEIEAVDRSLIRTSVPELADLPTQDPFILLDTTLDKLPGESAQRLRDAITPAGFSMDREALVSVLEEYLGGRNVDQGFLEHMMLSTMRAIEELDRQQTSILEWQDAEDKRRLAEERAALDNLANQTVLEGAHAAVSLVSTLVGLGDPKLSRELRVVGESALQVYESVNKFRDTMASFAKAPKLKVDLGGLASGMAGAALAMNFVGAAMSIISLFGEQKPTPEQMIIDQIGKLQQQIGELHRQMNDRFDRIEKYLDVIHGGLNSIFDLVNTRFDQLTHDVASVKRDADQIQRELGRQELLLGRLGQSIHKGLQEGFRHDFNRAFNTALGYRERNGVDMSAKDFTEWEGEFYTWAIDESKNDNELPIAGRPYDDDSVLGELERYGIEENVGFLSNWLEHQAHLGSLTTKPLRNPVSWATSASVYTQLLIENPRHATKGTYPRRRRSVEEAGEQLRDALRGITVKADGPAGIIPNHQLFEALITNYLSKAKDLAGADGALAAIEPRVLGTFREVDPWDGPQQTITHQPSLPANSPNTAVSFIPKPVLLADYLKLDSPGLEIWLRPEWINTRTVRLGLGSQSYGTLRVMLNVNYAGKWILSRHVDSTELLYREMRRDRNGEIDWEWNLDGMTEHWERGQMLKAKFEVSSVETHPPADVNQILARVQSRLREFRAAIYREILNELADGQSLSPACRRLDGAKALIDQFVSLGLPIALGADDFLRAMMYGPQSVPDSSQVRDAYLGGLLDAQPEGDDTQSTTNVRTEAGNVAAARAAALKESLAGYLDLIGSGKHVEQHALVTTGLARLSAASVIVRALNTDMEPPTGAIVINRGAPYSKSRTVTLKLKATDPSPSSGIAEMRLSNNGRTWRAWEPYATSRPWTLTSGDGKKTVYAQFRDRVGLASPVASASVIVDTVAPAIRRVSPPARSRVRDPKPTIQATVSDTRANLSKEQIALEIDGRRVRRLSYDTASKVLTYRPVRAMSVGRHVLQLAASDRAGNVARRQWSFTRQSK